MGAWVYMAGLLFLFCVVPCVLTIFNIVQLASPCEAVRASKRIWMGPWVEVMTLVLGVIYSWLLGDASDIEFGKNWMEQLYNQQLHAPIATEAWLTVLGFSVLGIVGYLRLKLVAVKDSSPVGIVCAIACMYLGAGMCLAWMLQIIRMRVTMLFLCLFPLNCLILMAKAIKQVIWQWSAENLQGAAQEKYTKDTFLHRCNRYLLRAQRWPLYAFLLMWPLLGIALGVLALFGQRPDSVVRAWTETADWNLSRQVGPQNIMRDEHYLCTVAAGGHPVVVKPLRRGVRHGHEVIVNRQLCVANAFEQLLQQRLPRFHRAVRHIYDTYGYPIAKHIRSPLGADVVYVLMKPLERCFYWRSTAGTQSRKTGLPCNTSRRCRKDLNERGRWDRNE